MKEETSAVRYTCDGCGKTQLVVQDEEAPMGYHGGHVGLISEWGGTGCDSWFACSAKCIRKAVEAAIQQADDKMRGM